MEGPIKDIDEAEVVAYAEKSATEMAMEKGITEEEKETLNAIADRRGKEAQEAYRTEQEKIAKLSDELKSPGMENNESPATQLIGKLGEIKEAFLNEKEFGENGKEAAKKVDQMIDHLKAVVQRMKNDFLDVYRKHPDVTPDNFFDKKYQLRNGMPEVPVFNKATESREVGKKSDIFSSRVWYKKKTSEELLNPKQEYFLYRALTGKNDFDEALKKEQQSKGYFDSALETVVPNVYLGFTNSGGQDTSVRDYYSNARKQGKQRNYSHYSEKVELRFGTDFMKKIFREAQEEPKK